MTPWCDEPRHLRLGYTQDPDTRQWVCPECRRPSKGTAVNKDEIEELEDEIEELEDEILGIIERRVLDHERNQQVEIGASGLGTPCVRKLGFRIAEVPPLEAPRPAWRPTVGIAVHTWLQAMLEAENERTGEYRWVTELRTPIGTIGGKIKHGSCDVYDRERKTIIDWKVCGPGKLKDYKTLIHAGEIPSTEYRVQQHVYARGLTRGPLKLDVEHVAILFLPMNGELREAVWWSEPYQPEVAAEAFKRARWVHEQITERGAEVAIPKLKRANDYCQYCPWWAPTEPASGTSCPGAIEMLDKKGDQFEGLL